MNVQQQIEQYIDSQTATKRGDMQMLHHMILSIMSGGKLWFLDGKNSENKIVSNPNIGYGSHTMRYADGTSKEFYQVGMSANTTGVSVYILGLNDKRYLARKFAPDLGKARVSGYCIKFKSLRDINTNILELAIRDGFDNSLQS